MKFNGYVALDLAYDNENKLGDWGTIVDAIHGAKTAGTTDGFAPKRAWSMSANRTRFGVTTTTPTGQGDVVFRFEGDFIPGQFRLRHGYGEIALGDSGHLLFGQTWSTFFDLDASPETVDFTGGVGSSNFDTARFPMIRYTIDLSKQTSLALAIEKDRTESTDSPAPGSLVGAFTYADDWGHVGARVLAQDYSTFVARTPTTPEAKYSKMALAWQVSGNLKLGKDNLQLAIVTGKGLGAYGTGVSLQAVGLNDPATHRYEFWESTGATAGYAHVWSDTVRSNLVLSAIKFKRDSAFTTDADIEKIENAFVNTFFTVRKNVELGVEYVYGRATSFGNAMTRSDGSLTDTVKESRLQMALQVNIF